MKLRTACPLAVAICFILAAETLASSSTTFTYQGRLLNNSQPVGSGTAEVLNFEFKLYRDGAPDTVGQLIGTNQRPGVEVRDGLFTVKLNYQDAFDGGERWIEVKVEVEPATWHTFHHELTLAPHSQYSLASGLSDYASSASFAEVSDSLVSGEGEGQVSFIQPGSDGANYFEFLGGSMLALRGDENSPVTGLIVREIKDAHIGSGLLQGLAGEAGVVSAMTVNLFEQTDGPGVGRPKIDDQDRPAWYFGSQNSFLYALTGETFALDRGGDKFTMLRGKHFDDGADGVDVFFEMFGVSQRGALVLPPIVNHEPGIDGLTGVQFDEPDASLFPSFEAGVHIPDGEPYRDPLAIQVYSTPVEVPGPGFINGIDPLELWAMNNYGQSQPLLEFDFDDPGLPWDNGKSGVETPGGSGTQFVTRSVADLSVPIPMGERRRNSLIGKEVFVDTTKMFKWVEKQMVEDLGYEEGAFIHVSALPDNRVVGLDEFLRSQIEALILQRMTDRPFIGVPLEAGSRIPADAWEYRSVKQAVRVTEQYDEEVINWQTLQVETVAREREVSRMIETGRMERALKPNYHFDGGRLYRVRTPEDVEISASDIAPVPDWLMARAHDRGTALNWEESVEYEISRVKEQMTRRLASLLGDSDEDAPGTAGSGAHEAGGK